MFYIVPCTTAATPFLPTWSQQDEGISPPALGFVDDCSEVLLTIGLIPNQRQNDINARSCQLVLVLGSNNSRLSTYIESIFLSGEERRLCFLNHMFLNLLRTTCFGNYWNTLEKQRKWFNVFLWQEQFDRPVKWSKQHVVNYSSPTHARKHAT